MLLLYTVQFDDETKKLFEEFYDNYFKLASFIVTKHIPADRPKLREDCFQDIWLACSDSFEKILSVPESDRSKYVSGIMRNATIKCFNKNVAQISFVEELSEDVVLTLEDPSESLSFLKNIEQIDLNAAMTKLPANMRKALEDYYLYDLSVEEIALKEEVSTHAIYKRIERGLSELRARLKMEGGYFE